MELIYNNEIKRIHGNSYASDISKKIVMLVENTQPILHINFQGLLCPLDSHGKLIFEQKIEVML
jgi:hypothetical protein